MARKLWIPTCTDTLTKSSKSFWIVIVPLLNLEERLSMSGISTLLLILSPAKPWKIDNNRVNFSHIISLFFYLFGLKWNYALHKQKYVFMSTIPKNHAPSSSNLYIAFIDGAQKLNCEDSKQHDQRFQKWQFINSMPIW